MTNESLGESNELLPQVFLCELAKLEFEFFRRVDSLLNKKRVHGIDGSSKAILARKLIDRFFVADEIRTSINALCGATN